LENEIMPVESTQSEHWTDDQLIDHCYGVGPAGGHLQGCADCLARFAAIEARRPVSVESVSDGFLAAQRRAIYARLGQPRHWWRARPLGRFAAAAAMLVVLAATGALYQNQSHRRELAESRADAQLAQDVSRMSFESEPLATAPLKGLFVE
jgi:hypothetical protein